jgi:hypothetical protein
VYVGYLRRKLGEPTIETVRGAGYEDVPAFVELESGGPSPGACRVVGHG